MDLWDILKVAARQWRVLVPMIVLTFSVALFVGGAIDPEYVAKGSLVLVGPNENPGSPAQPAQPGSAAVPAGEPTPVNPWQSFSSSLPITAQALAVRTQSADARDAIKAAGMSTSYEVTPDVRSPIVQVEARGQSSKQAVGTLNMLIDVANEELNRMQSAEDVSENLLITVQVLDQQSTATQDKGTITKLRIMILGLGVVASITAAYVTEGLMQLRRERKPARSEPGRHARGSQHEEPERTREAREEPDWARETREEPVTIDANGASPADPPRQNEPEPWTSWTPSR